MQADKLMERGVLQTRWKGIDIWVVLRFGSSCNALHTSLVC